MNIGIQSMHRTLLFSLLALASGHAVADGMQPASTVLLLNEGDQEVTMKVTNTDSHISLLHVSVESIPEDDEPLLLVTPALASVGAGKQQLIRFIPQNKNPLTVQRLRRVIFDGIPEAKATASSSAKVGFTVRQNIPAIISPKGLPRNRTPWTGLTWTREGQAISVANDTPYVVRLAQQVNLLPGTTVGHLPKTYILPGEKLAIRTTGSVSGVTTARIQPANDYGFSQASYDASVATK